MDSDDIIPHLFQIACAILDCPPGQAGEAGTCVPCRNVNAALAYPPRQAKTGGISEAILWTPARDGRHKWRLSNSLIGHEITQLPKPQVLVVDIPKKHLGKRTPCT
jgi:hypothetical protein